MATQKCISLVIPVYNEEEVIGKFLETLVPLVDQEPYEFEFIFVNDGSVDGTLACLLGFRAHDERVKIVDLSRNFGKERALAAGLQAASGEAVIPMDVDLQDPPELIHTFLRHWEEGSDVVVGVRRQRTNDSYFKRKSAGMFYRLFSSFGGPHFVANAGDYRLLDRKVLDALNSLPERIRFTKGLYAWVGFRQFLVYYDRPARAAGTTKWNGWKLWNFALDGITGFSTFPLRMWTYVGTGVSFVGFLYAMFLIGRTVLFGTDLPGYPSLMVTLLILGGFILLSLGILGEYLGRICEEAKQRPLYLVREYIGTARQRADVCPHCGAEKTK